MIPATQLRSGMAILHEGHLCRVLSVHHITPGNWRGMVQTKLRNLKTGNSFEYRFRSEDRVEKADLEEHEMEFLYASGEDYHFMNTESYEQVAIVRDDLGDAVHYLVPNTKVMVPQFIDVGELVRVDTAEGKYLERAK